MPTLNEPCLEKGIAQGGAMPERPEHEESIRKCFVRIMDEPCTSRLSHPFHGPREVLLDGIEGTHYTDINESPVVRSTDDWHGASYGAPASTGLSFIHSLRATAYRPRSFSPFEKSMLISWEAIQRGFLLRHFLLPRDVACILLPLLLRVGSWVLKSSVSAPPPCTLLSKNGRV